MAERPPHIPDAELERLLFDMGRLVAYPATPDFARAFETRPDAAADGLPTPGNQEVWRSPRSLGIYSTAAPAMDDRPRSRLRQALRFAGAAAAFAIIGLTLVVLFRELDDGGQADRGVPTPPPTEPLLIVVSSEGPVTAIDPETGTVRYIIDGGYQPDAIFSPDGTRLYVAGDQLTAYDASTGAEIWHVEYQYRLHWTIDTTAPSTLAISPDGRRLYVSSYAIERATGGDASMVPHFIQTFDTATGENLGESEPFPWDCTVPIFPSPDGRHLFIACNGRGSRVVINVDSGMLEELPEELEVGATRAAAHHSDHAYLLTDTGHITIIDLNSLAIVGEVSLDLDAQIAYNNAVLSPDGARLYIGLVAFPEMFRASEVLVFDTTTWDLLGRVTANQSISSRDLVVDRPGAAYGASTTFIEGTSEAVASRIWRMHPDTGAVDSVARLAAQEVAHVLLGYVPVTEHDGEAATPTSDATSTATLPIPSYVPGTDMAAIGTALAGIPEDVRSCTAIQTAPADRPVGGWVLAGAGDFAITRMVGDERAPRVPFVAGMPATVRIYAGAAPYPETAQPTIRAIHVESNTVIETGPGNTPRLIRDTEFDVQLWEVELTFSQTGCWEVLFFSDQFVGVAWLSVVEALPPTATPGPTPAPPAPLAPTPTTDTSSAAVEAALDALPADSSGCQATPARPSADGGIEFEGIALIGDGNLEALLYGMDERDIPLIRAGQGVLSYWAIAAEEWRFDRFMSLTATELDTGTQISADIPATSGTSTWRAGATVWSTFFTFPHAGCWQIVASTEDYSGVLWLTVEEESVPTPTPTPTVAVSPTPTLDTSPTAIQAALDALPAESKGCQVTPGMDGDAFGWEVRGVTLIGDGELWMSFIGNGVDYLIPPLQAGQSTSVYWNIGGSDADNAAFAELTATELGSGTQIGPDGPQNAGESPFFDGVMWKTYFTFPHAGCWQVIVERAGYAGVLWLTVEDAP